MLQDRDSIQLQDTELLYFSTEKLARVEAFPQFEESLYCGRCKLPLVNGQSAVRCPRCSVWHCEDERLQRCCWSYTDLCSACEQSTRMDCGYRWHPGDL